MSTTLREDVSKVPEHVLIKKNVVLRFQEIVEERKCVSKKVVQERKTNKCKRKLTFSPLRVSSIHQSDNTITTNDRLNISHRLLFEKFDVWKLHIESSFRKELKALKEENADLRKRKHHKAITHQLTKHQPDIHADIAQLREQIRALKGNVSSSNTGEAVVTLCKEIKEMHKVLENWSSVFPTKLYRKSSIHT